MCRRHATVKFAGAAAPQAVTGHTNRVRSVEKLYNATKHFAHVGANQSKIASTQR